MFRRDFKCRFHATYTYPLLFCDNGYSDDDYDCVLRFSIQRRVGSSFTVGARDAATIGAANDVKRGRFQQ